MSFSTILIANRGEIAVRVIRACRELGLTSVAIYSDPDRESKHVKLADQAFHLSGQPTSAYLDISQIISIAKKANAQAIHPGYGFLAENANFASACAKEGIVFIGPDPDVIANMGSKIEARKLMEKAGVPVVPGTTEPISSLDELKRLAEKFGYPLAIKASAGGGGRGLRVVRKSEELESAYTGAQREGQSYFASPDVYVEKYLEEPHHIEVQIIADNFGNTAHLFERECSVQRRHQKLIEEAPSPYIKPEVRTKLLAAAVAGAKSLGYKSAGTMEFLVEGDNFYFLEVNTRVQVEHPITEAITGIDIVQEQISIAQGKPLSFKQEDIMPMGHAMEFRINAEDPSKFFMPSPGTINRYEEPQGNWVRVDSACYSGYQILPFYDSLLAKLIIWGRTREDVIERSKVALGNYVIQGVKTTIPFHLVMLGDEKFLAGNVSTKYVEADLKSKLPTLLSTIAAGSGESQPVASAESTQVRGLERSFEVEVNQQLYSVKVAEWKDASQVAASKNNSVGQKLPRSTASSAKSTKHSSSTNGHGEIRPSMNGLVKQILVKVGDQVSSGQKLFIFEAMKMESEITATCDGKVDGINVKAGETVDSSTVLLTIKK